MEDGDLRQAVQVLESYEAQVERLNRQAVALQASMEDLLRARDTLNALKEAKEGDEVLLPIGASSYVNVKIAAKTEVIVGIGTRISVKKDIDGAVEFIVDTGNEVSDSLKKVVDALAEIENLAGDLSMAIQNEYRNRQTGQ